MKLDKLAIIAGEPSGDILAADLVAALTERLGARPELVGVGGERPWPVRGSSRCLTSRNSRSSAFPPSSPIAETDLAHPPVG